MQLLACCCYHFLFLISTVVRCLDCGIRFSFSKLYVRNLYIWNLECNFWDVLGFELKWHRSSWVLCTLVWSLSSSHACLGESGYHLERSCNSSSTWCRRPQVTCSGSLLILQASFSLWGFPSSINKLPLQTYNCWSHPYM